MMRRRSMIAPALLLLALAAAGCGVTAPQVPVDEIRAIARGTSAVATACGEAYQSTALAPAADLSGERRRARTGAAAIARVLRDAPGRTFQGETVRQISGTAVQDLRACGLGAAAAPLQRPR
jgi:hypothetical protein